MGHALTVLGTLIFGANLGLFAQIFHVSERMYNGFMAWALGALLVALVLRSVPNAIVALAASVAWFWGYVAQNETAFLLYPVLAGAVFLPMCYWWRSKVLFALSVLAVTMALIANTMVTAQDSLIGFAGLVVPIMVLWCCGAIHARDGKWRGFGVVARSLGALGLAGVAYVLSFQEMAAELAAALKQHSEAGLTWSGWLGAKDWISFGTVVLLALAAALAGGFRDRRGMPRLLVPVLAAAAIMVAPQLPEPKIWSTVLFNLTAAGLAAYGIGVGATTYERRPYWAGLGLIILLIASRFFEYETNLMIKAVGFLGAGFLLIYAGVKFEGRMRTDRGRVEGPF